MHRESVYVCTYVAGDDERVAHVRAWDEGEAADLFARELALDGEGAAVERARIRVRRALANGGRDERLAG